MSEAFSRAPEPDTSRVPRREGQSQAPVVEGRPAHVQDVVNRNQALQRAIEREGSKPPPEPERPPDPEATLAAPLDALPKWESERVFTLATSVQSSNGSMVTQIKMRAPQGLDVFEVGGMPTKTNWTQSGMSVDMDTERFKKWLTRLSNVDMNTINRIPARDLRSIFEWLNTELNQAGN